MKQNWLQNSWLIKSSLVYLILPFLIFCLTFLKIWIGIPVVVILGWITFKVWKQNGPSGKDSGISKRDLIFGLVVLGLWVFLSGIGGFAFQNQDLVTRNAIFKDLINFKWPVYYPESANSATSSTSALMYYIGYWLPAALIGKLSGWEAANIVLFIWTLWGVFLTAALLKERIKSTLFASSLLLIFFSGMDILGTLSIRTISPHSYPTAWPPITTIEWWVAGSFQYSSFTTQLFWVFNQAIPAWICMSLILVTKNPRNVFFIWALCFFCAPLPAVGMLPFILLIIPRKAFNPEDFTLKRRWQDVKNFFMDCLVDIKGAITPENILGGGTIFLTSFLYFSANPNGSKISLVINNALVFMFYIIFLIYEVMLLWLLFYKDQRKNLWWYVAGGLFIIIPFIRLGTFTDFCMRASIPALFLLMTWSGESLLKKPNVRYRGALILLMLIGAITPIYEINRSIYRTGVYYIDALTHSEMFTIPQATSQANVLPEYVHPTTLTADLYPSVLFLKPDVIPNYIGKIDNSFFFNYLANPP
jgi:hypothetical protein